MVGVARCLSAATHFNPRYLLPLFASICLALVFAGPSSQLLTMDVIELTLLLKSIGFRLNSIDIDAQHFAAKRQPGDGTPSAGTSPTSQQADAGDHCIDVQISCSQSQIVSNLSLQLRAATDTVATAPVELAKCTAACTCPKREQRDDNNSFWEVQSSGTFANRRSNVLRMVSASMDAFCALGSLW